MAHFRIACITLCVVLVITVLPGGHLLGSGGVARAEEGGLDTLAVDRAARRILRRNLPLPDRLAAATQVLEHVEVAEAEALVRAGLALLEEAPRTGAWLLLQGTDRVFAPDALRSEARAHVQALLEGADPEDARTGLWTAAGVLLGIWGADAPAELTRAWPPPEVVRAILRRRTAVDPALLDARDAAPTVRQALDEQLPTARALAEATSSDPEHAREALDALRALGAKALPLLLAEARRAAGGVAPGHLPRACRAVLVLGLSGRREATSTLIACLDSPDGWIQAAAATALGDLGDPSAAIALCHKLTYRGEVFRLRDQWDYPGERETTVAREDWPAIAYYVIDGAACDALIRLGVPGAACWMIDNQLDPAKANFRVRVMQDAVDSLKRAFPDAPVAAYNVDAGLPMRQAAFDGLLAWWQTHRHDHDILGRRLDADDAAYRREARRMVERLRGKSIFELQISQETCAILGPAVTPSLLETLAVTKHRVTVTEIARALGVVRDVAAVPALLELATDRASFVRAVAIESLGAYVGLDDRVLPALVARLDDPEGSPRVAALAQLVRAAPDRALHEAILAHPPAEHQARFGADDRDYRMAWRVARLVQEGAEENWAPIRSGLASDERYVRRTWWDLLRRALGLANQAYDANTSPATEGWAPIDEARVLEALLARRSS